MMVPRAEVCAERILRGARHRDQRRPAGDPACPPRSRGTMELRSRRVPLSRREHRCSPTSHSRQAGRGHRDHRLDRRGQNHAAHLIPRLSDTTAGTVLVDGVDVRQRAPEELWAPSAWCRSGRTCSRAPSPRTFGSATPTRPTTSCGARSSSRRGRTSCARCPSSWRRRSPRVAPTSPAASASGWRSRALSCARRPCSCSTTRSRRSTGDRGEAARGAAPRLAKATVILVAQRVASIRLAGSGSKRPAGLFHFSLARVDMSTPVITAFASGSGGLSTTENLDDINGTTLVTSLVMYSELPPSCVLGSWISRGRRRSDSSVQRPRTPADPGEGPQSPTSPRFRSTL